MRCSTAAASRASPGRRARTKAALKSAHALSGNSPISVEELTAIHKDTAPAHLGIEFLEVGDDFIRARVPVDTRTRQPYGLLHGGVAWCWRKRWAPAAPPIPAPPGHRAVGLDINANHLRGATRAG